MWDIVCQRILLTTEACNSSREFDFLLELFSTPSGGPPLSSQVPTSSASSAPLLPKTSTSGPVDQSCLATLSPLSSFSAPTIIPTFSPRITALESDNAGSPPSRSQSSPPISRSPSFLVIDDETGKKSSIG